MRTSVAAGFSGDIGPFILSAVFDEDMYAKNVNPSSQKYQTRFYPEEARKETHVLWYLFVQNR